MAVPAYALARPTLRAARLPQATPEEEESLLRRMGSGALSGLAATGNLLDVPGSMVRDVLGGENPFDQLLSPLTHENRLTGRNLMERAGILGRNRVGKLDWGDVGGFLGEVALDPLTYLTLGGSALGKTGQAFRKAGVLDDLTRRAAPELGKRQSRMTLTAGDLLKHADEGQRAALETAASRSGLGGLAELESRSGERLGGLLGVGLPFRAPAATFGTGRAAQAVAKGMDVAGKAIRFSPVGRHAAALFERANLGAMSRRGQEDLAQPISRAARESTAAARERVAPYVKAFNDAGIWDDPDAWRAVVRSLEGVEELPENMRALQPTVDSMKGDVQRIIQSENAEFVPTRDLNDMVAYFTRQPFRFADVPKEYHGVLGKVLNTTHRFQKHRRSFLRELTGGTDLLNDLSLNPAFSGIGKATDWQDQARQIEDYITAWTQQHGYPVGQRIFEEGESVKLAKWLAGLDPRHVKESVPVFGTNPIDNLLQRLEHGERAVQASRIARDVLSQNAGEFTPNAIPLRDVITGTKLAPEAADDVAAKIGGNADDLYVPKELADDMARVMNKFTSPDEIGKLGEMIDKVTNLWKGSVTTYFPAFHARNRLSGMVQNMLNGAYSLHADRNAKRLITGHNIRGLRDVFGGATDEEATQRLATELFAHNVAGPGQGLSQEVAGGLRSNLKSQIPGLEPVTLRGTFVPKSQPGVTWKQKWNPLKMAGVGADDDVFLPGRVGRNVGHYVESMNRISPYIELRRQGFSAAEAARKVKLLQVDYNNLSQFERRVMRRAAPFYTFSRGMSEYLVKELAERPGGALAQTIRAEGMPSREGKPLPDYVSQTSAVPLGQLPDGSQRFLTGMGTMHSEPLAFGSVRGGLPDVSDTLSEAISRSNPLAKMPLELAAGESFFQRGPLGGRELQDMDPTVGRLLTNLGLREEGPTGRARPLGSTNVEHVLANLPFSRALTTARTLTDPRKREGGPFPGSALGLNLLTGARVSDVSPAAQDAMLRDLIQSQMRESGGRVFEKAYFPSDAELTPEQRDLQLALAILAQRAKERKGQ